MRILEMVSGHAVNGAVKHCRMLSRELARRGHDVTVACRPNSWIAAELAGDPVDVVCSTLGRWPADELRRIAQLIRRQQVDVVHSHMSRAHFFGVLLKAFVSVPVVATAHTCRIQVHWALNDHVIAVSEDVARFERRWNLVGSGRITVIHQFVDLQQFQPASEPTRRQVRASLGLDQFAPVAGIVGSVFPEKGIADLIAAWPAVLARVPHAHLVIVGDGPHEFVREMSEAIAARTFERHVTWLGRRDDVARLMGAFDVLVMPSLREAAGLAALEAMAAGLPIVATAVGGVAEFVRDRETGLLVRRGDIRGLADGLALLLSNEPARRQYGAAARVQMEKRFSMSEQVPKIEALLDHAARTRPRFCRALSNSER